MNFRNKRGSTWQPWIVGFLGSMAVLGASTSQANASMAWVSPQAAVGSNPTTVTVYGMRKFPYPYDAMLAISSDADHETLRKFNLIHEFINTRAMTPMGRGLGLDFADSVFMYNGSNLPGSVDYHGVSIDGEMSYFRGTSNRPLDAMVINHYIQCGWIDTLHSFGDFSALRPGETRFTHALAARAIQALEQNDDQISVWTDHGNMANVDDFGSYGKSNFYGYQQGATPTSHYNIQPLLARYGIRFVWGDVPSDQFGYYSIIYPKLLPDGHRVWGFWRYTNSDFTRAGNPIWAWTVGDLDKELTIKHLLELEDLRQYAIVAQHLSANNDPLPLPKNSIEALKTLAEQYHEGHILVTRTSRLLQYNVTQQYLAYHVTYANGTAVIHLDDVRDPVFGTHKPTLDQVRGITFYTSDPARTVIDIGNTPLPNRVLVTHETDGVHPCVGIQWFPADTNNYAVSNVNIKVPHRLRPLGKSQPAAQPTPWIHSVTVSIGQWMQAFGF